MLEDIGQPLRIDILRFRGRGLPVERPIRLGIPSGIPVARNRKSQREGAGSDIPGERRVWIGPADPHRPVGGTVRKRVLEMEQIGLIIVQTDGVHTISIPVPRNRVDRASAECE